MIALEARIAYLVGPAPPFTKISKGLGEGFPQKHHPLLPSDAMLQVRDLRTCLWCPHKPRSACAEHTSVPAHALSRACECGGDPGVCARMCVLDLGFQSKSTGCTKRSSWPAYCGLHAWRYHVCKVGKRAPCFCATLLASNHDGR